jgi:protein-L-isoaspartate(D-aspartate) O-methyltransferase
MPRDEIDFADARAIMVDGQVQPNGVHDERVLQAMRTLPRERFLPADLAALAYGDEDVPLGGGRVLLKPMLIARLVQLVAAAKGERVLVIGAGSGYGAALLAACGADVTALEEDAALLALARAVLPEVAPAVRLVGGELKEGCREGAPFDAIFIEGAVEEVPTALAAQLAPHGRLITVRTAGGLVGQAVVGQPVGDGFAFQAVFDCLTTPLPQFRRAAAFVF